MRNRIKCPIRFSLILALTSLWPTLGSAATLFDWNDPGASEQNWPGWTWSDSADGFGSPGWRRNDSDSYWFMPRSHAKAAADNVVEGRIDKAEHAPGTSGASLKVSTTAGNPGTGGWWFIFSKNFGMQGLSNANTNRLSLYLKSGTGVVETWTADIDNYNSDISTYLCWAGGASDGADCPKEADGQHYYHYLTINPGAWLHVELDQHPQHRRGVQPIPLNNPASPKNYFENMNSFYVQVYNAASNNSYWVDEIAFSQTSQPENDISISTVWVGYWSATDKWEIGWNDGSFVEAYNSSSYSTFEIRWSTAPITNANYSSATLVEPEFNEFGTNHVRRPTPWKAPAWTRFTLPALSGKVYFAIKDVSSTANGDGHNSQSSLVRTIDYTLGTGSAGATLTAPRNLRAF